MPTWFEIQCEFELNGHTREELKPNYLRRKFSKQPFVFEDSKKDKPKKSPPISVDPKWPNSEGSLDIKRPCFYFPKIWYNKNIKLADRLEYLN